MYIGMVGPAGAGKDTAADFLIDAMGGRFIRYSMASYIKQGLVAAFGWTGLTMRHFIDRDLKEAPLPVIGKSPRFLAQRFGTEYGRDLVHKDVWLLAAKEFHAAHLNAGGTGVVITDVRFENEAELVRGNGVLVHIRRPGAVPVEAHISESGVPVKEGDFVIDNTGSLSALRRQIEEFARANLPAAPDAAA